MPNYEYKCRDCQHAFTVEATIKEKSDGLTPECPSCDSKDVFQTFSSIGIIGSKRQSGGCCGPGSSC